MGMANEIEQLEYAILLIKQDGKDYLDERDIPILETAMETMRKYQKIVQIMERTVDDGTSMYDTLQEIEEVIEDEAD